MRLSKLCLSVIATACARFPHDLAWHKRALPSRQLEIRVTSSLRNLKMVTYAVHNDSLPTWITYFLISTFNIYISELPSEDILLAPGLMKIDLDKNKHKRINGGAAGDLKWRSAAFIVVVRENWEMRLGRLLFVHMDEEKDCALDCFIQGA
jgi:hypothetical protein